MAEPGRPNLVALPALIAAYRGRELLRQRMAAGVEEFSGFLTHTLESVAAYADVTGPPVVGSFPLIDRSELADRGPAYRSAAYDNASLINRTTTGTSGVALTVPRDAASDYRFVYQTYRLVFDRAAELDPPGPGRCAVVQVNDNPSRRAQTLINPELGLATMHHVVLGGAEADADKAARFVAGQHPQLIGGRPRGLLALVDRAAQAGVRLNPQVVLSTGDNLHPDVRDRLESGFGAPVYNGYASQEGGLLALECPHRVGLVSFGHVRAEVATGTGDAGGEVATSPRGSGLLVVTSSANWALPLIRYQTGDHAELADNDACDCGPQVLTKLSGRDSPYFVLGGRQVNPSLLNPTFQRLPITQFRVTQFGTGDLEVEWVAAESAPLEGVERAIRAAIEDLGGSPVVIRRVVRIGRPGEKVQRFRRS